MNETMDMACSTQLAVKKNGIDFYLDKLYSSIPNSMEFKDARRYIETWYKSEKPGSADEKILVMPNYLVAHNNMNITGFKEKIEKLHSNNTKVVTSDIFDVKTRSEVEYNPLWLQFVVGVVIKNKTGDKVALLKTTNHSENRVKEKITLVQGHVTATESIYTRSLKEIFTESAVRELLEETDIAEESAKFSPMEHILTIHDTSNTVGFEHMGYIYRLTLNDNEFDNLKSNEEHKHEVIILDKTNITEVVDKGDNWLKMLYVQDLFL